ncbi:MAG TPA: YbaN family protein [Corynebacterium sp.]|nr:YbaN family protein [Corynebacterium sp.]
MLKPLYLAIGVLSTILGAVGVLLPVLPTTPFLLLAAFCFARSSRRLHEYLINHRILGTYIYNYYHHAMTPPHKARTLAVLWFGILVSCLIIGRTFAWILLPVIASLVSWHLLRLKPRPEQAPTGQDPAPPGCPAGPGQRRR